MCDLTKILVENQKDMQKLKASTSKTLNNLQDVEGIDSEAENVLSTTSSTPIKTETTTQKNNPITSRNMATGVLIDSTNLLTPKNRYNNARRANKKEKKSDRQRHHCCMHHNHKHTRQTTPCQCRKRSQRHFVFDGKSENFERFEELFCNNIKMYPNLTGIQKKIFTRYNEETHSEVAKKLISEK